MNEQRINSESENKDSRQSHHQENKGSIRDISVSKQRSERINSRILPERKNKNMSYKEENKKKWPKYTLAFLLLAFLFLFFTFFFHKAEIVVVPKPQTIVFKDDVYSAIKSGSQNNKPEALNYDILTLTLEDKKIIPSVTTQEVSKKALGKIKIINNSSKTQRLRKETRFQTGDLV